MKLYNLIAMVLNAFMFVDLLATPAGTTAVAVYVLDENPHALHPSDRDASDPLDAKTAARPVSGFKPN